jgi:predicted nuclease with RNAse H fold
MDTFAGIDYGSKTAGTTAICFNRNDTLFIQQSIKNKDADKFILDFAEKFTPEYIFIDAPLSLPGIYFKKGDDYFYRQCDREVNAMSPMFLGGLTARAIRIKDLLSSAQIKIKEVYPAGLVKILTIDNEPYKAKDTEPFWEKIKRYLPLPVLETPVNWHQVDAVLAWLSGYRFYNNENVEIGNPEEGVIII